MCVSALLCLQQNQLRYDMIRSRFQHSFVIQSVLNSYLVGIMLNTAIAVFFHCYFIASVVSLKCARARGMSSMSSCLFVCLFVHHFLASLRVQGILKGSLYTQQVDQVEKVAYRWSAIDKNGLEARKTLVLTRG